MSHRGGGHGPPSASVQNNAQEGRLRLDSGLGPGLRSSVRVMPSHLNVALDSDSWTNPSSTPLKLFYGFFLCGKTPGGTEGSRSGRKPILDPRVLTRALRELASSGSVATKHVVDKCTTHTRDLRIRAGSRAHAMLRHDVCNGRLGVVNFVYESGTHRHHD